MGANNHPTVDVSNEPETIYAVVDRRDSYHPHTVGKFNNKSAAKKLKENLTADKKGPSNMSEDRWFVVRETPVFESVEEYENHDPRDSE